MVPEASLTLQVLVRPIAITHCKYISFTLRYSAVKAFDSKFT